MQVTHLVAPWLKRQSAWAWQNWPGTPHTTVVRSQNRPVKPIRQESGLQRPSESGRLSHCPWIQGQAEDRQVRCDTRELSSSGHRDHLYDVTVKTYFCHSLVRICWRTSSTGSESHWSLDHRYKIRFLRSPRNTATRKHQVIWILSPPSTEL